MKKVVWILAGISVATGCKKQASAPTDLVDLAPYLFGNQADPTLLSGGLTSLATWMDTRGAAEPGYILPALSSDAVAQIVIPPGTDPADTLGGFVDAQSTATLDQQVAFIMLPDQSVVNPNDYSKNERAFVTGGDCFADETCERLTTTNDIIKTAAFGVTIPYVYFKDYQWATYTDADGNDQKAVVSRGWIEVEGWDDAHQNGVRQSYTLDVFMDTSDGTVHRSQALWTEMVLVIDGLVSQDFLEQQLLDGLTGVLSDTDAAIIAQGL